MSIIDKWFGHTEDHTVLVAQVQVGELCRQWIGSEVGKYVVGAAEQYEYEVLRKLANVDPTNEKQVMQLQERAKVPGLLLEWLDEAISNGETAQYQLEGED